MKEVVICRNKMAPKTNQIIIIHFRIFAWRQVCRELNRKLLNAHHFQFRFLVGNFIRDVFSWGLLHSVSVTSTDWLTCCMLLYLCVELGCVRCACVCCCTCDIYFQGLLTSAVLMISKILWFLIMNNNLCLLSFSRTFFKIIVIIICIV